MGNMLQKDSIWIGSDFSDMFSIHENEFLKRFIEIVLLCVIFLFSFTDSFLIT